MRARPNKTPGVKFYQAVSSNELLPFLHFNMLRSSYFPNRYGHFCGIVKSLTDIFVDLQT